MKFTHPIAIKVLLFDKSIKLYHSSITHLGYHGQRVSQNLKCPDFSRLDFIDFNVNDKPQLTVLNSEVPPPHSNVQVE